MPAFCKLIPLFGSNTVIQHRPVLLPGGLLAMSKELFCFHKQGSSAGCCWHPELGGQGRCSSSVWGPGRTPQQRSGPKRQYRRPPTLRNPNIASLILKDLDGSRLRSVARQRQQQHKQSHKAYTGKVPTFQRRVTSLVWNSFGGLSIYDLNIKRTWSLPVTQLLWRTASCLGTLAPEALAAQNTCQAYNFAGKMRMSIFSPRVF